MNVLRLSLLNALDEVDYWTTAEVQDLIDNLVNFLTDEQLLGVLRAHNLVEDKNDG